MRRISDKEEGARDKVIYFHVKESKREMNKRKKIIHMKILQSLMEKKE